MTRDSEDFLRRLFGHVVALADPMRVVPKALPPRPTGRVVVIGAGKASARMAEAVEAAWGSCEGIVITRYGYARPCRGIDIIEASHPLPDAEGMKATSRILDLLAEVGEGDFVLALISGGGSALLCAPADGMSLEDKQAVHRALLESGVPIGLMNTVRKHLSCVKGGQLSAAAYPAKLLALAISDVPGDVLADIASGATVGERSVSEDAVSIINHHHIPMPQSAIEVLSRGSTVIPSDDPRLATTVNRIIAAPSQSLTAAKAISKAQGKEVQILGDAIEGEAREEGARQANLARDIQADMKRGDPPLVLLSGGECTVTGWGGGVGGPNAEFTLAAAVELDGQPGIHLIACDTDGVDGAAEVAGAVAGPDTLDKARIAVINPSEALARNDSHTFFAAIGGQVVTGPTLTNVNDFRAILIAPTGG